MLSQQTLRWDSSPDGSFETAYKQQNNPIPFQQEFGPGAFAGELVTWTAPVSRRARDRSYL